MKMKQTSQWYVAPKSESSGFVIDHAWQCIVTVSKQNEIGSPYALAQASLMVLLYCIIYEIGRKWNCFRYTEDKLGKKFGQKCRRLFTFVIATNHSYSCVKPD